MSDFRGGPLAWIAGGIVVIVEWAFLMFLLYAVGLLVYFAVRVVYHGCLRVGELERGRR